MSNGELFDGTKYEVYVEPTEFVCVDCEETITDEDTYFEDRRWVDGPRGAGEMCYGCYEYELSHASTVFWINQEETRRYYVADWVVMDEYGETDFYRDEPTFMRGYHSTDGWRGYHETRVEGWEELTDLTGWTTGDWGDYVGNRKRTFNDWVQEMCEGDVTPPVEVVIAFDPTSNVFSTAIGVWVPEGQSDAFREWLGEDQADALSESLR